MIANNLKNKNVFEDLMGSRARVKILKSLAINEELTISQIISNTKLNYKCTLKHLNFLKMIDLIQEKKFGRIKIFRYKLENMRARTLKKFIELWEGDYL